MGASSVALRDQAGATKDSLQWTWTRGAATSVADLGDPTVATGYDLCVYDGTASLVASAAVEPAGTCDGRPCWTPKSGGFRYASKSGAPHGVVGLDVRAGANGKARVGVKARGAVLALPTLPIGALPLTVQLGNDAGTCWSARYEHRVRTSDADGFKAKSD